MKTIQLEFSSVYTSMSVVVISAEVIYVAFSPSAELRRWLFRGINMRQSKGWGWGGGKGDWGMGEGAWVF